MRVRISMPPSCSQMRSGEGETEIADQWSPQINIGASVLMPEAYVPDLNVRMALYRRLTAARGYLD